MAQPGRAGGGVGGGHPPPRQSLAGKDGGEATAAFPAAAHGKAKGGQGALIIQFVAVSIDREKG